MAGTPAACAGIRLSDHISLGVIARTFPLIGYGRSWPSRRGGDATSTCGAGRGLLRHRLGALGRRHSRGTALSTGGTGLVGVRRRSGWRARAASRRPALGWVRRRCAGLRAAGPTGRDTRHRGGVVRVWRLVGLDGSCLDVADTRITVPPSGARRQAVAERLPAAPLCRPGRTGTRVLFGAVWAALRTARRRSPMRRPALQPGVLCLADRQIFGHALWQEAASRRRPALAGEAQPTAAARGGAPRRLLPDHDLPQREGSAAQGGRRPGAGGEYRLEGIGRADTLYRS